MPIFSQSIKYISIFCNEVVFLRKFKFLKFIVLIIFLFTVYVALKKPEERIYKVTVVEEINDDNLVEDFNGKLNKDFWNAIEQGDNYNNELQYFHPNNINIRNGLLEIEAKKELYNNHQYTSGLITTKNKFEFLYGKIIFRAKPAVGNGLLSAVWLLPADDSFYPEMDIIEVLGSKSNEIWSGLHYLDIKLYPRKHFITYQNDNDFLLYEFQWDENEIRGYINNKLIYKTNAGIPNKKMYLIINLAVGGDWPGNPDDNIFPSTFLIDYVMVIPKGNNTP